MAAIFQRRLFLRGKNVQGDGIAITLKSSEANLDFIYEFYAIIQRLF